MALEALRDVLVQGGRDYFNMTRQRVDDQRAREQMLADEARRRDLALADVRDQRAYMEAQQKAQNREAIILRVLETGAAKNRAEAEALVDSGAYGEAIRTANIANTRTAETEKFKLQQELGRVGDLAKQGDVLNKALAARNRYQQLAAQVAEFRTAAGKEGEIGPLSATELAAQKAADLLRQYNAAVEANPASRALWDKRLMDEVNGGDAALMMNPAVKTPQEAKALLGSGYAPLTDADKEIIKLNERRLSTLQRSEDGAAKVALSKTFDEMARLSEAMVSAGIDPTMPVEKQPAIVAFKQRRSRIPAEFQGDIPDVDPAGFMSAQGAPKSSVDLSMPETSKAPVVEPPAYFGPGGAEGSDPYAQERKVASPVSAPAPTQAPSAVTNPEDYGGLLWFANRIGPAASSVASRAKVNLIDATEPAVSALNYLAGGSRRVAEADAERAAARRVSIDNINRLAPVTGATPIPVENANTSFFTRAAASLVPDPMRARRALDVGLPATASEEEIVAREQADRKARSSYFNPSR